MDIGSQFFKLAHSNPDGSVKIFTDQETNSVSIPSAVAVKFLVPHSLPLSPRDYEDIEVRTGRRALAVLRSNASLGSEFVPRTIGRSGPSEFKTSAVASDLALFTMLIYNAMRLVPGFNLVAFAIPSYWTREQLHAVSHACRIFDIPLGALVTDAQAVSTLYATTRLSRFRNAPRHVLFVDVGGVSTKVFAANFTYDARVPTHDFVDISQTANEWSESIGGYHFAKEVAEAKGVSLRKAQKMLIRNGGEGLDDAFADQLVALESLVSAAVAAANRFSEIDEVQLIGGASSIKAVAETIRQAANHSIRRDFNANEAIAMGAAIATMTRNGESPYIESRFYGMPAVDLKFVCGNVTVPYCVKNAQCRKIIDLQGLKEICTEFSIVANPRTLPEGIDEDIAVYGFARPINLTSTGNWTASFLLSPPDAVVNEAHWCNSDDKCERIETRALSASKLDMPTAFYFISNYTSAVSNKHQRTAIVELVEKLNVVKAKMDRSNVEAPYPMTDEMKETVANISAVIEKDGLNPLDHKSLVEIKTKLQAIATQLHVN
jgi:hypothetical protein